MSSMKQDRRKGEQEDYRVIDDKAERGERRSTMIMETKKTGDENRTRRKEGQEGQKGE